MATCPTIAWPSQTTIGSELTGLLSKMGTASFAREFAAAPTLSGTLIDEPRRGVSSIASYFTATRRLFSNFTVTDAFRLGDRSVFEWEAAAFGRPAAGATVLVRRGGKISDIEIFVRSHGAVMRLGRALAERLSAADIEGRGLTPTGAPADGHV